MVLEMEPTLYGQMSHRHLSQISKLTYTYVNSALLFFKIATVPAEVFHHTGSMTNGKWTIVQGPLSNDRDHPILMNIGCLQKFSFPEVKV